MLAVVALVAACGPAGGGNHSAATASGRPSSTAPAVRATPARHLVELPEAAPETAQWILDGLRKVTLPTGCPVPELSNMLVLDSDVHHDRADVAWLVDDVIVCAATITRHGDDEALPSVLHDTIDNLAAHRPFQFGVIQVAPDMFTVFLGAVGKVTLRGDDRHTFGPVHQRTVALGGGRVATFVEYRFAVPYDGAPLGPDLALCPASGTGCREAL